MIEKYTLDEAGEEWRINMGVGGDGPQQGAGQKLVPWGFLLLTLLGNIITRGRMMCVWVGRVVANWIWEIKASINMVPIQWQWDKCKRRSWETLANFWRSGDALWRNNVIGIFTYILLSI